MHLSKVPYKKIYAESVNTIAPHVCPPCPECPPAQLPINIDTFHWQNGIIEVQVPVVDFLGPVFKPYTVNIGPKSQIVCYCEQTDTIDFASVRNNLTTSVNYPIPWDGTRYLVIPSINPLTPFSSNGNFCFGIADQNHNDVQSAALSINNQIFQMDH